MESHTNHHELQPSNLEAQIAVMAVEVSYMRKAIDEIKESRRVSWPSVSAVVISGLALLLVFIEKFGQ